MADVEVEREEVETQEQPESLRDTLERVTDEVEAKAAPEPKDEQPAEAQPEATPAPERTRDESGKFAKTPKQPKRKAMETAEQPPGAEEAKPVEAPKTAPFDRAPASIPVELRDAWAKEVSPRFREYLHKREGEVTAVMRESAEARRFEQSFSQVAAPYAHVIAAEGSSPLRSFASYLVTANLMRFGLPEEKADMMAQLCKRFGVPLEALDQRLSHYFNGAQPNGQPAPQYQPQQFRDPRLDQLLASQQQQRQAYEQQAIYTASSEMGAFQQKAEFFDDVRPTMELLFDAAARQDRDLSWEEAYEAACRLNPHIQTVLKQREEAERTKAENAQKARRANVSLRPGGAGAGQSGGVKSLRETIEEAAAEHGF